MEQVRTSVWKAVNIRRLTGVLISVIGIGGIAFAAYFLMRSNQAAFTCANVDPRPFSFNSTTKERPQRDLRRLNETIKQSYQHEITNKKSQAEAATAVGPFLQNRKNDLVAALYTNPSYAANIIVSGRSLRSVLKGSTNCLEKQQSLTGTLHVLKVEDFSKKNKLTSVDRVTITTPRGENYALHFLGIPSTDISDGAVVNLSGTVIDHEIALDSKATVAKPNGEFGGLTFLDKSTPSTQSVSTTSQTIVIPVYFQDQSVAPAAPTLTQISSAMFAAPGEQTSSVNAYYQENSYSQLSVQGLVHSWIQIPTTAPSTCTDVYNEMAVLPTLALAVLQQTDSQFNPADYQHYFFIMNGPCDMGATNTATGNTVVTLSEATSVYVLAHELGHQLGLMHAGYLYCDESIIGSNNISDPRCRDQEYGDWYDILGGSFVAGGHFNAYHKELLNWFQPENVVTAVAQGTSTFTLEPIETISSQAKVLKVPRGDGSFIYVEYRQPVGFDLPLQQISSSNVFSGALLHIHRSNNPDSSLVDPHAIAGALPRIMALEMGEQFTDPMSGTVLRVTAKTPTALTVEVTQNFIDHTAPIISMSALPETASGLIDVTVTATDPESGINTVYLEAQGGTNWVTQSLTTLPYRFTIDTTRLANGPVTIQATATNNDHLSSNVIAQTVVYNQDIIAPTLSIANPVAGITSTKAGIKLDFDPMDNTGIAFVRYWYQYDAFTPIPIPGEPLYDPPYTISETFFNGGVTLFAQAIDYIGNSSPVVQSHFFVQSAQQPNASFVVPQNNSTVKAMTGFTTSLSFCPAATVHLRIILDTPSNTVAEGDQACTGNNVQLFQPLLGTTTVSEGGHAAYVVASHSVDYGGWPVITTDAITSTVFTLDSTNPIVSIPSFSKNTLILEKAVQIRATATDMTDITRFEFLRNQTPDDLGSELIPITSIGTITCNPAPVGQTCSATVAWDTTRSQNGLYNISIRATDRAGNTSTSDAVAATINNIPLPTGEDGGPFLIPAD